MSTGVGPMLASIGLPSESIWPHGLARPASNLNASTRAKTTHLDFDAGNHTKPLKLDPLKNEQGCRTNAPLGAQRVLLICGQRQREPGDGRVTYLWRYISLGEETILLTETGASKGPPYNGAPVSKSSRAPLGRRPAGKMPRAEGARRAFVVLQLGIADALHLHPFARLATDNDPPEDGTSR